VKIRWDTGLLGAYDEAAQEFVIQRWLDKTRQGALEYCCVPLFSTFRLITNLKSFVPLLRNGLMARYNISQLASELLFRLGRVGWLKALYPSEIAYLEDKLQQLQASAKNKAKVNDVLENIGYVIEAFASKIRSSGLLRQQIGEVAVILEQQQCDFIVLQQLDEALDELLSDAFHLGHSSDFLYRWMQRYVIGRPSERTDSSYVDRLLEAPFLGEDSIFIVFVPTYLPEGIVVGDYPVTSEIPEQYRVWENFGNAISRLTHDAGQAGKAAPGKQWLVLELTASDYQAAIDQAERNTQLLFNTRLAQHSIRRSVEGQFLVAVKKHNTGVFVGAFPSSPDYKQEALQNAGYLFQLSTSNHNAETYARLERALYWFYGTFRTRSPLETKFNNLWIAAEYLFSKEKERQLGTVAMKRFMAPYVVMNWARSSLLELCRLADYFEIAVPREISTVSNEWKGISLASLWDWCYCQITDEVSSCVPVNLDPVLAYRVQLLGRIHPLSDDGHELSRFVAVLEKRIEFDIDAFYRTRNRLVHEAATEIVDLERIFKRLDFFLRNVLEQLLFRFRFNSLVSLEALHVSYREHYEIQKQRISEGYATSEELLDSTVSFLA